MKVSHPRFLSIANRDDFKEEFPACLQENTNAEQSVADSNFSKMPRALFSFPEDTSIHGGTPLLWPMWLRAAVPGNISLSITIYYEMEDVSSIIKYRTLRMHYNLQNREKSTTSSDNTSSGPLLGSSVILQASADTLFDISGLPLADFHYRERLQQRVSQDDQNTVDFIFFSRLSKGDTDSGISGPRQLFSHHACHCSILGTSPITWLVDGPRSIHHNFSASFCEVNLKMIIYNSSDAAVFVRVNTSDSLSSSCQTSDATVPSENQAGWHNVPIVTDIKVTSQVPVNQIKKLSLLESVSPFIWSGSSATSVHLQPMSTTEIPMKVCVFSPGMYDLSNYALDWKLLPVNSQENRAETRQSSGTCPGYPYFLTVLPSA